VFGKLVAVAADEGGIGEFEARRVLPDRCSVEQDRLLTAKLQPVARDEAGIGSKVALFLCA
jgi:hypothetical protein